MQAAKRRGGKLELALSGYLALIILNTLLAIALRQPVLMAAAAAEAGVLATLQLRYARRMAKLDDELGSLDAEIARLEAEKRLARMYTDRYYRQVFLFSHRMTGEEESAAQIATQVLETGWNRLAAKDDRETYLFSREFGAYLLSTASREAIEYLRRLRAPEPTIEPEYFGEEYFERYAREQPTVERYARDSEEEFTTAFARKHDLLAAS